MKIGEWLHVPDCGELPLKKDNTQVCKPREFMILLLFESCLGDSRFACLCEMYGKYSLSIYI